MKPKDIDNALMLKLQNDKYYTLEELSKEIDAPRADIHRSFARLKMQSGWSITPNNGTPYWRCPTVHRKDYPRQNRGREKGEVYNHEHAEPDWERTSFYVRRPDE